jgi:hypothetical protein
MKHLKELINENLVNENWSQQQEQEAHDKILKAFQNMSQEDIFNLVWDTFNSQELESLYDEMEAGDYL